MDTVELFERFAVALAIGLLIGIERGWQERDAELGSRTAGLRTHTLLALLGAVAAAIDLARGNAGTTTVAVAFAVSGAVVAIYRFRETTRDSTFGATTVVASMLAFMLGAYAVLGEMQVAAAAGVAVAGLLSLKGSLHGLLKKVSWVELRSALLLLAMTVILLPILPDRTIDPWQAVNPFELWLMTVMIAAVSFAGYVAFKVSGDRSGVIMNGIAGGLVSSTAVTLTLSRMARQHPARTDALRAGILLAGATMMIRTLVIVGLVNPLLLLSLLVPIGLAAGVQLAAAVAALPARSDHEPESWELSVGNPFDPLSVLSFGALLTVISFLAKLASLAAGALGALALAAASGLVDVDAISLSMARLASAGTLQPSAASGAILIAVAVNSISKAGMAFAVGGPSIGRPLALLSLAAVGAGAAGHAMVVLTR